jgi:hypothetical protein
MDKPMARRVPWGQLVTLALLALLVAAVFRAEPGRVAVAAAATTGAAFVAMRRVQGYFWGLAAALLLVLHPLHAEWQRLGSALWAEAMELVVLAAVVTGCHLAALPCFAPWAWALTTLALCGGAALTWPAQPQAGLVGAVLTALGLVGGTLLAWLRHRERPAWSNLTAAALLGLGAPAVGLLLAPAGAWVLDGLSFPNLSRERAPLDFLAAAVSAESVGLDMRGFEVENLHRWAWPAVWAVLPLMLWGLWCTLARGWRELAARRPPLPWLLTLYAAADLAGAALHPGEALEAVLLPLASLAVLLAVFGVAEVFRRLTRPLLLPPPEERLREEAEGG